MAGWLPGDAGESWNYSARLAITNDRQPH